MEAERIAEIKTDYAKYRTVIEDKLCSYENCVIADVAMTNLVSELELSIDKIRANVPIYEKIANTDLQEKISEGTIKRIFLNESAELRYFHRITKGLLSTIKSKMFNLSR